MADPVYDEDLIKGLLGCPVTGDTIEAVQTGAAQALIDLYDRKATRDEFLNNASACVALYGQCSRYAILASIKRNFESGDLSEGMLLEAEKGLSDIIRAQAEKVIDLVKRLQQCPTSKDPVH